MLVDPAQVDPAELWNNCGGADGKV